MSKKITERSKYPSKYAVETWISPSQYIAELICESIARSRGEVLIPYFWMKSKFWRNTFVRQCGLASKLLKNYPALVIISSIAACKNLTSLASPIFKQILAKNVKKINQQNLENVVDKQTMNEEVDSNLRPSLTKQSLLDLDNE